MAAILYDVPNIQEASDLNYAAIQNEFLSLTSVKALHNYFWHHTMM